jgi:exodeoxyribonuclease V alpha subunit
VSPKESVLEAVLERITYANEETGYTIARVATERSGPDLLTVVGPLLGAQVGKSLRQMRAVGLRHLCRSKIRSGL